MTVLTLAGLWSVLLPLWALGGNAPPIPGAGLPSKPVPLTLRVGVLTLFQPQEVVLKAGSLPVMLYLDAAPVVIVPGGFCRVTKNAGGMAIWHGAQRLATATRLTVSAESITVEVVGRKTRLCRQFRGTLTVTAGKKHLQLVVAQPLEAVVAAVLSAELAPETPLEAAKAIAVVARSYLVNHIGRHADQGFDVCDSTHCQLFYGEWWTKWEAGQETQGALSKLGKQAAAETCGEVLREADGRLAEAYFTACCGGQTTTPAVAFGTGQTAGSAGVSCQWCRNGHFFTWTRRVNRQTLARAILPALTTTENVYLQVAKRTPEGFVISLVVKVGSQYLTLPNYQFRRMVGRQLGWNLVLSNRYYIEPQGDWFVLHGRGFGHQVGLCLAGAIAQARAGRPYRDILRYYFPKVGVGFLSSDLPQRFKQFGATALENRQGFNVAVADDALFVNDEHSPVGDRQQAAKHQNTICLAHVVSNIFKQWEGKGKLFGKLFVRCHVIGADAQDNSVKFLKIFPPVAVVTQLGSAYRGAVAGIKYKHYVLFAPELGERIGLAVTGS